MKKEIQTMFYMFCLILGGLLLVGCANQELPLFAAALPADKDEQITPAEVQPVIDSELPNLDDGKLTGDDDLSAADHEMPIEEELPAPNDGEVAGDVVFVGAEKVACVGVAPQECYLVKVSRDGEWEYFYDEIEGFVWESGFEYELRVQQIHIANPPVDGSSIVWTLLEVVQKTAVSTSSNPSFINIVWTIPAKNPVTIEFDNDGQMHGSSGCNSFAGSYQTDGNQLDLSQLISTMMACEEEVTQREIEFLAALATVSQYRLEMDQLILSDSAGNDVLVFMAEAA